MALRVLLADESATIKKIFQLALQDFGVEVTTVALGVDVVPVAKKFQPDIVFADVLLQKKSGYDVCKEIKSDAALAKTPVVLVWSGFMELDQAKYKESKAEAHLEKPFDTNQLRSLVQKLVPKTQTNPLAGYLSFPKLPDFDEGPKRMEKTLIDNTPELEVTPPMSAPVMSKKMPPPPPPEVDQLEYSIVQPMPVEAPQSAKPAESWNMEHFEEMPINLPEPEEDTQDEFVAVELQPTAPPPPLPTKKSKPVAEEEDENLWVQKSLANYKLKKEELVEREPSVVFKVPEEKMDVETFVTNKISATPLSKKIAAKKSEELRVDDEGELELDLSETPTAPQTHQPMPQFNEHQLEALIRAQSKEVIEKVVWQVVPEIATQIIERELKRLLQERDQKL